MIIIQELYRILFGRSALQNGNVIDMSEHGRVGGVNTGQGFKAVQELPNKTYVDESVAGVTYIGDAKPGTSAGATNWRLRKILVTNSITYIEYPEGNDTFNYEWDERGNYTYS